MSRFDVNILETNPVLRKMIGGHGNQLQDIRPLKKTFETWLRKDANDVPVRGWVVFDHDGWKRDLIRLKIDANSRGFLGMSRVCDFVDLNIEGLDGVFVGFVLHVPFLGFVVKEFTQGRAHTDGVTHHLSICYTLSYEGLSDKGYIPNIDFED